MINKIKSDLHNDYKDFYYGNQIYFSA